MLATIKPEYKTKRVVYNNSGAALGKRTDYNELAIIAHESGDKSLLRLFDNLPDLATLKKAKTESELKRPSPAAKR